MTHSMEGSKQPQMRELKREGEEQLKSLFSEIQTIIATAEPNRWLPQVYKHLRKLEQKLDTLHPDVQLYFRLYLPAMYDLFHEEARSVSETPSAKRALEMVHKLVDLLPNEEEKEEPAEVREFSLKEILKDQEHFHLEKEVVEGREQQVLQIRSSAEAEWQRVVLPSREDVLHKGGTSRVLLKIMTNAPQDLIDAELPMSDVDALVMTEDEAAVQEAERIGADPDGIELAHGSDLPKLIQQRDTDFNQCFLSRDGLSYTDEAVPAAKTGHIHITSKERKVYGDETFYYEGELLIHGRGLYRLMKFVAERKARSFDLKPLNRQVPLGIYWLVLARKLARKSQAGEVMDRLYELGKKLGQVHEGEEDVIAVLDRVHEEFPFFHFEGAPLDDVGVARWLSGKFMKYARKKYRRMFEVPSAHEYVRAEGDTIPEKISLDDYQKDEERLAKIQAEWPAFLARCEARTKNAAQQKEEKEAAA